jgi:RHS repeat-associated protein
LQKDANILVLQLDDGLYTVKWQRGYGYYSAGDAVPVRLKRLAETLLKTRVKVKPPTVPHAVTSVLRPGGTDSFTYDDNGNMTCRVEGGMTYNQVFNVENRMETIQKLNSGQDCPEDPNTLADAQNVDSQWDFVYDGDGNRVKQVNPDSSITLFLGGGLYTVEDAAGTPSVTKYYAIAGQRVAMEDVGGLQYLLTDHLGSIVAVTDASGTLVPDSEQRYMPFGEPWLAADEVTDFGYTGQRSLADVGLMDYNARWYDAALGRFVSADSLVPGAGNPQAFNRYAYVGNNPMRLVDPSGNRPCGDGEDIDCEGKLYINPINLNKGCGGQYKPCGGVGNGKVGGRNREDKNHIRRVGEFQLISIPLATTYAEIAEESYSGYAGSGAPTYGDSLIPSSDYPMPVNTQQVQVVARAGIPGVIAEILNAISVPVQKLINPFSQNVSIAYSSDYYNAPTTDAFEVTTVNEVIITNSSWSSVTYAVRLTSPYNFGRASGSAGPHETIAIPVDFSFVGELNVYVRAVSPPSSFGNGNFYLRFDQ